MTRKVDRFEKIAIKASSDDWNSGVWLVHPSDVAKLLRNEHKWMRRMVKDRQKFYKERALQLPPEPHSFGEGWDTGVRFILRDILSRLTQRRRKGDGWASIEKYQLR